MTFPKTTTIVPRASRTNIAWMLTAGFAVPLGEGTTLVACPQCMCQSLC